MGSPTLSQAEAQKLKDIMQQNSAIMRSTQWQWVQLANNLSNSANATYATGTSYSWTLANSTGYVRGIRVWVIGLQIDNASTTTAGTLNRNGFYQMLGQVVVRLGNHLYRVPGGAIPLLAQTFSRDGFLASYPGNQTYGYSSNLFDTPATVAISSNATYTGYVDIPLALLEMVGDSDGITPTLSNTGLTVEFTTPSALQGADCMAYPFGTGGTLTVDGTKNGTILVYASMARQLTVADTGALPPFVVGPAFIYEDVPVAFVEAETFYPFQGQQSNLLLAKSIVVIDSPGELANEYSNPVNVLEMDLMYDANTPVFENRAAQNPLSSTYGLMNQLVDQRKAIGDQPSGVYVFDFIRGTNANYPNSTVLADLEKFSRMGVRINYAVAPQSGSQLHLLNVYVRPDFFQAAIS